jgi:hypothetical protein
MHIFKARMQAFVTVVAVAVAIGSVIVTGRRRGN